MGDHSKKSLKALCFQGFFFCLEAILALQLALFLRQTLDEPLHTGTTSLHGRQIDVRHVRSLMSQQPGHGEVGIQETVLNLYQKLSFPRGGNEKSIPWDASPSTQKNSIVPPARKLSHISVVFCIIYTNFTGFSTPSQRTVQ